jgi:hypothetical protein
MQTFTHSKRLAVLMSMTRMGPAEFKQAVPRMIPKDLAYQDPDGKIFNARELLTSQGPEVASGLIPVEVYATIIEGSEPARCIRETFPVFKMASETLKVPYGETGTYAQVVAEGAEIPIQDQTYGAITLTAAKYAVRPLITTEMINDSKFDVVARELRKAGLRVENALNRLAIDALTAANATTYETEFSMGTPVPLKKLGSAIAAVQGRGFQPTDIIMVPGLYGDVLGAFTAVFTGMAEGVVRTGSIGTLLGCNVRICGIAATTAANWRYTTNDDIAGFVVDRDAAGALGMREDINIEQYKDPIRDMVGMKVAARFDFESGIAAATQALECVT